MGELRIGLLHPGSMGGAVGTAILATGAEVGWLPEGRSPATRRRASEFVPIGDLASRDLILSICPPAAALEVAEQVVASGFTGDYLEANAISPARARQIADLLTQHGIRMVDGGIIGPPPRRPGTTRLYLSGPAEPMARFRALFETTALRAIAIPIANPAQPAAAGEGGGSGMDGVPGSTGQEPAAAGGPGSGGGTVAGSGPETDTAPSASPEGTPVQDSPIGAASALKLAFSSYNKITQVLAGQAHAMAQRYGVGDELLELADATSPGTPFGNPERLRDAAAKAWRWTPEFHEIAAALTAIGAPAGLPEAAAEWLGRWSAHKDDPEVEVAQLIADLIDPPA